MINSRKYFKNKKITIMGLGLLGRGLGYTKFLAECGADLIVTDLKTKQQLATSVKALLKYNNPEGKSTSNGAGIKFVLGEHRLEDFRGRDMIIKNPGIPLDSVYIEEARKNKIPIEMDVSLFAKCAPEVMIIGVTGTRGKSMTTTLIYEILKQNENLLKKKIYIGGNIRGVATLPLLKKVKAGDIIVCELDSWQLQGFGESHLSPHISVFTTFMLDHMNYYKNDLKKYFNDKANIFKYQTVLDTLIIGNKMKKYFPLPLLRGGLGRGELRTSSQSSPYQGEDELKSNLIVANKKDVADWKFIVPGEHQRENLACAVAAVQALGVPKEVIRKAVSKFKGIEGRLQYVKTVKGVKIYNDNNATTPEATIAGLEALGEKKNIILISGGASKQLDSLSLANSINKYCKEVVLLKGTGTDELIKNKLKVKNQIVDTLKDAIMKAVAGAKKGDILLFSPAFASFGMFTNEYDRNDQFMKIIKKLK